MPIAYSPLVSATMLLLASGVVKCAQAQEVSEAPDFLKLNLRELADQEVTSVSRKKEKASETAAAIYVITAEDIRLSGLTSLPEILRLAPGFQVAQAGSSQWAISSRGFNDQFSNKLLVMIDGRTVYNPHFSGVFWDLQTYMLEDIERIELVRGPGATVWGDNAVNGVVNIITKSAIDTQGGLAVAGYGNKEEATRLRYGYKLSDATHMRAYASYQGLGEAKQLGGELGNNDSWQNEKTGFRLDSAPSAQDQLTVQGDLYHGTEDQLYTYPAFTAPFRASLSDEVEVQGGNLLTRWQRAVNENSDIILQAYISQDQRDLAFIEFMDTTYDVDLQHHYRLDNIQEINWGMGYRLISDKYESTEIIGFSPEKRDRSFYNGFFQYERDLIEDELLLTLGSKLSYEPFSEWNAQPSARLSWLVSDKQTLWSAVSHAVRTPNRSSRDQRIVLNAAAAPDASPFASTVLVRYGNENPDAEELTAYEVGYRVQPRTNLSYDIALFFNDYKELVINRFGDGYAAISASGVSYYEVPLELINAGSGYSYGGEAAINWKPYSRWELEFNYSYLNINLDNEEFGIVNNEGKSPMHQFGIHSNMELTEQVDFDQYLYYVDSVDAPGGEKVESYERLDLRLGWKAWQNTELSLAGRNLLDDSHSEFGPFLFNNQAEIGRSVYGQLRVGF